MSLAAGRRGRGRFGRLAVATAAIVIADGSGCLGPERGEAGQARATGEEDSPAPPRYVETRAVVTQLAHELLRSHDVTGVSLALVDSGEVVWAAGFGLADVDRKLAASPRTLYNVGSLAKPVTAAAVLQAADAGRLGLDQPLAELIPDLVLADGAERRITLAQLLSHQSGLPSDWFVHELSEQAPPWTEIVAEIRGLELAAEPGRLTRYSNLGVTLAGVALAHADRERGRSFEQIVTEDLLRPAQMRTAYFPAGPGPAPVQLPLAAAPAVEEAAAYRDQQLRADPPLRMVPAAGLRASVLDLAAFASLLLDRGRVGNRQVLAPATVDALLTPRNGEVPDDLGHAFGYGWFLDHERLAGLGRVAWHGGRTQYHHAELIVLVDLGLAVAVASNSQTAGAVVDALALEALRSAAEEKLGRAPDEDEPEPAPALEPCAAPPDRLAAFAQAHAGEYVTSTGLAEVVAREREGDVEIIGHATAERGRLSLDDDHGGRFDRMPEVRLRFVEHAGAELIAVERPGQTPRASAVRLGPPPPVSDAWRARLGRWTVERRPGEAALITDVSLSLTVSGRLVLAFTGLIEHPPLALELVLEPLDDRRARIAGRGRGQGSVLEVRGADDDERLWWTGRSLRRAP